jgi:hypothetical protein
VARSRGGGYGSQRCICHARGGQSSHRRRRSSSTPASSDSEASLVHVAGWRPHGRTRAPPQPRPAPRAGTEHRADPGRWCLALLEGSAFADVDLGAAGLAAQILDAVGGAMMGIADHGGNGRSGTPVAGAGRSGTGRARRGEALGCASATLHLRPRTHRCTSSVGKVPVEAFRPTQGTNAGGAGCHRHTRCPRRAVPGQEGIMRRRQALVTMARLRTTRSSGPRYLLPTPTACCLPSSEIGQRTANRQPWQQPSNYQRCRPVPAEEGSVAHEP